MSIVRFYWACSELNALSVKYKAITESQPFIIVKEIRDNFVHNKSSSYYGMNVVRLAEGVYASTTNKGFSTQETYNEICALINSYEQLCGAVNNFIEKRISKSK